MRLRVAVHREVHGFLRGGLQRQGDAGHDVVDHVRGAGHLDAVERQHRVGRLGDRVHGHEIAPLRDVDEGHVGDRDAPVRVAVAQVEAVDRVGELPHLDGDLLELSRVREPGQGDELPPALQEEHLGIVHLLGLLRRLPVGEGSLRAAALDAHAAELDRAGLGHPGTRGRGRGHLLLAQDLDLHRELEDHALVERDGRLHGDLHLGARLEGEHAVRELVLRRVEGLRPGGHPALGEGDLARGGRAGARACPSSRRGPRRRPRSTRRFSAPVFFDSMRRTWVSFVSFTTEARRRSPPLRVRASAKSLRLPPL